MIPAKPFYMIRHGETEHNAAKLCTGITDSPLTAKGLKQAEEVIPVLQALEIKPSVIIQTNLSRSKDTAQIINAPFNLPVLKDIRLTEQDRGETESKPIEIYKALLPTKTTPPNGESFRAVEKRLKEALEEILSHYDVPPLIVSHLGIFRAFGGLYNLRCHTTKNCALYEFEPTPENTEFPWLVWHYSIENKELCRQEVSIYAGKWM